MKDRILLALWGAVFGLAIGGLVLAAIGATVGWLTATAHEIAAVVAFSALVAVALFAISEQSLGVSTFGEYVASRPLANAAARLAVLATLLSVVNASQAVRRGNAADDGASLVAPGETGIRSRPGVAVAIGALVALAVLATVGDRSWQWLIAPLAAIGAVVTLALMAPSRLRIATDGAAADTSAGQSPTQAIRLSRNSVMSGSLWMLGAAGAVSIGSFVFWVAAARLSNQSSVGAAAALFSVVTFLNYATAFGLPIALSRFGRADGIRSSVLFTWCVLITMLTSLIGVGVFAIAAPGSVRSALAEAPTTGWLLLAANTVGMSVSVLVDVRYMTLGRWRWVFWRSVTISVIRLPFLLFVEDVGPLYLFALIAGAYTVTGVVWLAALAFTGDSPLVLRPIPADAMVATRYALVNYVAQLALQAPFFAIPVIVLATQSTEDNASFYIAWGILTVVVVCVQVVGQVLLVEGRGTGRSQARVALAVSSAVTLSALAFVAVFGGLIRAMYGQGYEEVTDLLTVLVAGTVPYAWTVVELSVARIRQDNRATAIISSLSAVMILVPAFVLTNGHGAIGAAWAWLLGNALTAMSIRVLRPVIRRDLESLSDDAANVPDPLQSEAVDGHMRREPS
jgi:O-antigen/teichoic acid export membrane protein